jgi:hypothetical protein
MVLPMDMCDYDAHSGNFRIVCSSVADPDPPDPHVSGPPGSGSTSQRLRGMDPDPSIIMQK